LILAACALLETLQWIGGVTALLGRFPRAVCPISGAALPQRSVDSIPDRHEIDIEQRMIHCSQHSSASQESSWIPHRI